MNYKRIEQMSAQIYKRIVYHNNYVGVNSSCKECGYIVNTMLSLNALRAFNHFIFNINMLGRISSDELCLQTVFTLDWEYLNISNNRSTIDRLTKELKDNNIALRYDTNRYVVSLDYISAFKIPQRKRYVDRISKYLVDTTTTDVEQSFEDLSGSPGV